LASFLKRPRDASSTGTVLTGDANAAEQNQTGELRFMIITPEALAGSVAQADKVTR